MCAGGAVWDGAEIACPLPGGEPCPGGWGEGCEGGWDGGFGAAWPGRNPWAAPDPEFITSAATVVMSIAEAMIRKARFQRETAPTMRYSGSAGEPRAISFWPALTH